MGARERVRDFVTEKVRGQTGEDHAPVADDQSVLLSGLLSSLTMVEIILFVEREFGLDVVGSDIRIEDFDTVDSICAVLEAHGRVHADV